VGDRFTISGRDGHDDTEWEVVSRENTGGGYTTLRIRLTDGKPGAHRATTSGVR
jgi:hypothetical protein